ncbi:MAG: TetR/AcrR family transcriptional regulator [Acidimicrobiales bacterium]
MTAAADGRRLRSVRTREAVVDALLSLYDDGIVRPGAAQLAERAGVSQSSVFRLFQDLEDIVETAVEHQWTRLAPLFEAPPDDGDVAERVDALVAQRLRLYEAAGTAMRAGRLVVPDSPAVQAAFGARRALLRDQVAHQFAPELGRAPRARRRTLLDALDVASGLDQVAHLVEDRAFSTRHAGRVMSETLTALLREAP